MERHLRYIDGVEIAVEDDAPEVHPALNRREERSRLATRARIRSHLALAMFVGIGGLVALLMARPNDKMETLAILCAMATLHLFLFLPWSMAKLAGELVDEARGATAEASPHAELVAIPDIPRPVYFHHLRAAVAPFRFGGACESCWRIVLAYALPWVGWMGWLNLSPKWNQATLNYVFPFRSLGGSDFLLLLLPGATALVLFAALGVRLAAGFAVGTRGRLGELAPLALQTSHGVRDAARLAKAEDLDETWGRDPLANAAGYVAASGRRWAADIGAAAFLLAAYAGLIAFGAWGMGFLPVALPGHDPTSGYGPMPTLPVTLAIFMSVAAGVAFATTGAIRLRSRLRGD
jgi:hypothetical protein